MNQSASPSDRPRNAAVFVFLALLLIAGGAMTLLVAWRRTIDRGAEPVTPVAIVQDESPHARPPGAEAAWLTEFTLTDQQGQPFGTNELKGKVYVTSFFFASCPGPCRQENLCVRDLHNEFGEQGVVFLSITCDPEHDTPEVLQKYAGMFGASDEHWKFLTGELLNIRRIGAEIFGLAVDKQTHSEDMIVTDRWGKIRGRYHWNNPQQIAQMKLDLAALLAETAPPDEGAAAAPAESKADAEEESAAASVDDGA